MQNPPHPGGIVRRQCLDPLGLSVTEAAAGLGVSRQALSELVNEKAGISVEMAVRLSKAFGFQVERPARQPSIRRRNIRNTGGTPGMTGIRSWCSIRTFSARWARSARIVLE